MNIAGCSHALEVAVRAVRAGHRSALADLNLALGVARTNRHGGPVGFEVAVRAALALQGRPIEDIVGLAVGVVFTRQCSNALTALIDLAARVRRAPKRTGPFACALSHAVGDARAF